MAINTQVLQKYYQNVLNYRIHRRKTMNSINGTSAILSIISYSNLPQTTS